MARANHSLGKILCRLRSESQDIRSLGAYLREHKTHRFVPYFAIQDSTSTFEPFQIPISEEIIQNMKKSALFDIGDLRIPASSKSTVTSISFCMILGEELPISGFPRTLAVEEPPTSTSWTHSYNIQERYADLTGFQGVHPPHVRQLLESGHSSQKNDRRSQYLIPEHSTNPNGSESENQVEERMLMRLWSNPTWRHTQEFEYPRCDRCQTLQPFSFFHCYICSDDDFDICKACVSAGKWCHDKNHQLRTTAPLTRPFCFRSIGETGIASRHDNGELVSFGFKPKTDDAPPVSVRSRSTGDLPNTNPSSVTALPDPHGLNTPNPIANALLQSSVTETLNAAINQSTKAESTNV